jgi:carbon storage regulator
MLVLARRTNESIIINDNVEIVVIEIRRDQVKIGVRAPKEVPVYRKEVYEEIQAENIQAASAGATSLDGLSDILARKKKPPTGNQ